MKFLWILKYNFLLILIIFCGAYLRLSDLEKIPSGLYVDEASTGVNSWSILQTGKDEYGKILPVSFRFLGSYTPPLYTYLTSPIISIFGLSVSSVRLLSAISGILLIPLIYFFIKSLNITKNLSAILGTLFFAISPGAIFFSRIGYEVNLAFLLYCLGMFFLWLGLKKPYWIILGMAFLSLSTNAYHTQRLLAHLSLLAFFIIFYKTLLTNKFIKSIIFGVVFYFLFLLPQISIFFTPANTQRGFGLFNKGGIIAHYFTYLSPRNLFFQPDSDLQRSLPELSLFYPWMAIFYLVGLFWLVKSKNNPALKFIFMLFLLTPIPASLTGDPFATQRALPIILPVIFIITAGVGKFLQQLRWIGFSVVVLLTILSLLYLYRSMAVLLPNERAKIWGYGFEQLAKEIKTRPSENFLIDTSRIKPAYIELAFFLKLDPNILQESIDQKIKENYYNDIIWSDHYKFLNIETRAIKWEEDIYRDQILVGDELAISEIQAEEHFLSRVFEIKSPTQEIIFKGFRTNPTLKCQSQFIAKKCQFI